MKKIHIFCMLALFCFIIIQPVFGNEYNKKVRIGYVEDGGYILRDDATGRAYGYGVNYMDEIKPYTKWNAEYIGGSITENLKRLKNGEIDIIACVQKEQFEGEEFEYTEYPLGTVKSVIYAVSNEEKIFYEDYSYVAGKKVGYVKDSIQQYAFEKNMKGRSIAYSPVVFESVDEMLDSAEKGELDLFVSDTLYTFDTYSIIDMFDPQPVFFMGKSEDGYIDELNFAVASKKMADPDFDIQLFKEFFRREAFITEPLFTSEEYEYIKNAPVLKVGQMEDNFPYSAIVDEEFVGINIELLRKISQVSGLKLEPVSIGKGNIPQDSLIDRDNEIDIVSGVMADQSFISQYGLIASDAVLEFNILSVIRNDMTEENLNSMTIVIPIGYSSLRNYIENMYPQAHLLVLENYNACMDALLKGTADATIMSEYSADYILQNPKYDGLRTVDNIGLNGKASIVVNDDVDPVFISIINKTLECINSSERTLIASRYIRENPYNMTIWELIYKHRIRVFIYAVIILVLGVVAVRIYGHITRTTIEREQSEELRRQLEYDDNTELYDKQAFYQNTDRIININRTRQYSIVLMDIEKFKIINDLFGRKEGDKLLKYFADKLKEITGEEGVAGYYGADKFVICIPTERILNTDEFVEDIQRYINTYPIDITINVCFGIYNISSKGVEINLMCDRANLAANSIKGNEMKRYAFYDDSMRIKLLSEQVILNEMQPALDKEQFKIYVQPKCNLETGELIGGEALVRWVHPEKGVVAPGTFIPLFEKNGFITKLDYYVWEQTCKIIRGWKDMGISTVPLSVNISRMNFYLPDFEKNLEELFKKYNLTPGDIYLEITESAYTTDPELINSVLCDLQNKGYMILMDDFGSGYSSLNMLKEAPLDVMKLDMKFLLGKGSKEKSEIILQSVIEMANKLKFKVIAEGVETKEQCELLSGLGCKFGQGYFFSKPIAAEEFKEKYLTA